MPAISTVLGVLLGFYVLFFMPVTVGDVSNLQMLNDRTNLMIAAAALFVGGCAAEKRTSSTRPGQESGWQKRASDRMLRDITC